MYVHSSHLQSHRICRGVSTGVYYDSVMIPVSPLHVHGLNVAGMS